MRTIDGVQLVLLVGLLAVATPWMGRYLVQVLDPKGRTWLDPLVGPLERFCYRVLGIDPEREQTCVGYGRAMLWLSGRSWVLTYGLLRLQSWLPLNPQGFAGMSPDLAWNTAVSFATNTNWQSYAGESTLSHFSQMVALTLQNFVSAAVGIAIAAAVVRGLARTVTRTLGNFWVDLIRSILYLLLPGSLLLAVFLGGQGVVQNFKPDQILEPVDALVAGSGTNRTSQVVVQGPMASQVAIKMLGTNGGGYANANAAHPFENPTPLSNFVQILSIFLIGCGLTSYLGRMTRNPAHGWSIWVAMMVLFVLGVLACTWAEAVGNPLHQALGVEVTDGNMEGKEVRFGIFGSTVFTVATTAASCGAVNSMLDSYTPLGGLVALFNIQLGEVIVGGVGAGLYGMLVFVVLTVFIAGLMIGRTPEYLGKRIGAYEVKMAMLALIAVCVTILVMCGWASSSAWGGSAVGNAGPHGLTELLYAYSSAAGNNGSAFGGLSANTPWMNLTLGVTMMLGRYFMIVPLLALAGSLGRQRTMETHAGSFPVSGVTFVVLLVATIVFVGALNFLPALALGPILEHFLMLEGRVF